MPLIELVTIIEAPIQRCFDLSRSIDLHKISTEQTAEEAVAGVTSGLIGINESVTWRAKHLGLTQTLSTIITEFNEPVFFVDEMEKGAFKSFRHEHHFENLEYKTKMTDHFDYCSPLGLFGKLLDLIFLERYMTALLVKQNSCIKEFAESEKWREVLT